MIYSFVGERNQYIQLVKVLYCKLPTIGKQVERDIYHCDFFSHSLFSGPFNSEIFMLLIYSRSLHSHLCKILLCIHDKQDFIEHGIIKYKGYEE